MQKNFRKTLLAAAVAGVMAAGVSGGASAYVYGTSRLLVQNFTFVPSAGLANVVNYTFTAQNQTNLNGVIVSTAAACAGIPGSFTTCGTPPGSGSNGAATPVLNALVAQQGVPVRGENVYTFTGPSATNTYVAADNVVISAELVGPGGIPIPGNKSQTNQIVENNLAAPFNGASIASSELQSTTNLNFTVAGGPASFTLAFEADVDQRVAISELLAGIYSTAANVNTTFTLTRTSVGGGNITWTPDGILNKGDCVVSAALAGAGATCAEIADGGGAAEGSLNHNLSTGLNGSDLTYGAGGGFNPYQINMALLPAGDYSLSLNGVVSDNKIRITQVPEPASLALVALGLLGLRFGSRRRGRTA